jgi:hypothetical protein
MGRSQNIRFHTPCLMTFYGIFESAAKDDWPTKAELKRYPLARILDYCAAVDGLEMQLGIFCETMEGNFPHNVLCKDDEERLQVLAEVLADRKLSAGEKAAFIMYFPASVCNRILGQFILFYGWNPRVIYKALFPRRKADKDEIPDWEQWISVDEGGYEDQIREANRWLEDRESQDKLKRGLRQIVEAYAECRKTMPRFDQEIRDQEEWSRREAIKNLSQLLSSGNQKARFKVASHDVFIDNVAAGITSENGRAVLGTLVAQWGQVVRFTELLPGQQKNVSSAEQPLRDAIAEIKKSLKAFGFKISNARGTGYKIEEASR